MNLLENDSIDQSEAARNRLSKLKEAAALIEQAVELEDGTRGTMRRITDLLKGKSDPTPRDRAVLGNIRARRKLSDEMLKTYSDLLTVVNREIDRINEGGAIVRATELAEKFEKQHQLFLELRKSLRTQPWWKTDTVRRARVMEIMRNIEDRMHRRRLLATRLIEMLRDEIRQ